MNASTELLCILLPLLSFTSLIAWVRVQSQYCTANIFCPAAASLDLPSPAAASLDLPSPAAAQKYGFHRKVLFCLMFSIVFIEKYGFA